MTKIYEALELAGRSWVRPAAAPVASEPALDSLKTIEETMIALYQNINSLLAGRKKKAIQFIGSRKGEGTSTLIRELAKVVAFRFNESVLLLDADRRKPSHAHLFDITPKCGWDMVVQDGKPIKDALYQVGSSSLFISQASRNSHSAAGMFDSTKLEAFFAALKEEFDLILIDSPPATVSTDSFALSRIVDGIVLVVEAQSTRYEVAQKTLESIGQHGGSVLGVVLNKRRYPIPKFIYNRI